MLPLGAMFFRIERLFPPPGRLQGLILLYIIVLPLRTFHSGPRGFPSDGLPPFEAFSLMHPVQQGLFSALPPIESMLGDSLKLTGPILKVPQHVSQMLWISFPTHRSTLL